MDSNSLEDRVESLEDDVDQLNRTVENLEVAVGNTVTGEQLEKAKSDLFWKFVMFFFGALGVIAAIVGVVIGVLAYLSR